MEKLQFNESIGKDEVKILKIRPVFCVSDISINFLSLPSDTLVTYKVNNSGVVSDSKPIDGISSEKDFDELVIEAKNFNEDSKTVAFDLEYKDESEKQFADNEAIKFMDMSEFADLSSQLEDDLNMLISVNEDQMKCIYFRVKPELSDNVFREHTYKAFHEKKCLNLIVPDNKIPSLEDAVMTEWGSEYSTFDAEISKKYFESIFGIGEQPTEDDYILLIVSNKMFEIRAVNIIELATGETSVYTLKIGEYQEKISREEDEDVSDITVSHEEKFGVEVEDTIEDTISTKENTDSLIYYDEQKSFISSDVVMSENMYDMGMGTGVGAIYKPSKYPAKNISFKIHALGDTNILNYNGNVFKMENGNLIMNSTVLASAAIEETHCISINIYDSYVSVVKLDPETMREAFYEEVVLDFRETTDEISLYHGDYEISRLAVRKSNIDRNKSNLVFSEQSLSDSGSFIIYDTFKPTYNAADGNQSKTPPV